MAETRFVRHGIPCGCCGAELRSGFNRRRFMQIAGAGLAITLPSFFVVAAEGNYEAMVLTCIDPRIQEPVWKYLAGRDLTANTASLSSPVRPSASSLLPLRTGIRRSGTIRYVDSIAPYQESDCDRSPRLRRRQDCYGEAKVATPQAETDTHRAALGEFRKQVAERYPQLGVEIGLMALNGAMEMFN